MDRWITDNEPSERYPTYTRANAGEVMPDPISPLTGTLGMMKAGEAGWRDAYVNTGSFAASEFEDDRPNTIGSFGGYLYLNMSATRLYGVRCPGLTPEIVDFQYFGEMPGIPPYEPRPGDEDPERTAQLQTWIDRLFTDEDLPEPRAEKAEVDQLVAARPDLRALSDDELIERARRMVPWYRRLFERHISVSGGSGLAVGTVAAICQAVGRPELTMTLVAGVGDVDSAAPSWALWELSRQVRRSPALTAAFEGGVTGLLDSVGAIDDDAAAAFAAGFESFVRDYGARGPNEWELRSDTWGTKPELALVAIDRMRLAGDDESPESHTETRRAERLTATAEVEALVAGDAVALGQFHAGIRASRLYLAGRERTKTNNIKVVHEMRLAMRELGRRHHEAGHLDVPEDIFMLRDDELDAFAADPGSLHRTTRERAEQYRELFDLQPPFIIHRTVPPLSTWSRRDKADLSATRVPAGTVLTGIPGCPGKATGRARVILDPSAPQALEPGDVLVAPITDPAWTPLFVPAAAVVVDVGAQISHAVIVSRELGIPCVVSVIGATGKIPDGAMITVDGSAGTVTVH
jgi:pyruvate,water dikinase